MDSSSRQQRDGLVPGGYNPVTLLDRRVKPRAKKREAKWLEADALALLLEAARTYEPVGEHGGRWPVPFGYELCATCALTEGRPSEVLGLEVSDVSFDRQTVTFRPNRWRRLKTKGSARVVPLWPQLEEIMQPYMFGERPPSQLLFPSYVKNKHNLEGAEAMLTDFRKTLDAIGTRIGHKPRELNLYVLRHSYCAARLQTLDHEAPVSPFTVGGSWGTAEARSCGRSMAT